MVVVNLGRRHGVEAEAGPARRQRQVPAALQRASSARPRERGVALRDLEFAELDELWDAAKAEERAASHPPTAEQETAQ